MRKDKVFHLISNTHWDREWRFPYQRNRQMLVDMIDDVLAILEKEPEYRAFHLDSQSVVLTDYCEIRPHKKELIKKLVKQKRLFIGPWFILPDEFLVGGENLIRNLLLGHRICKEFGRVSKIGYSPFSWGQISQLPQLYREFGIELIMFYRGINSLESHNAEFIWEGADGTKSLSSRFSTMPRYNFYFYIYRQVIHNEGFGDVAKPWNLAGVPFHFADAPLHREDYFNVDPADTYYRHNVKAAVDAIVQKQADDFTTPHVIWMEGHDSSGPNIKTVQIMRDIRKDFPGIQAIHSTLEDYAESLAASAKHSKLPVVRGERRSAQYDARSGNLYGYTTSARMFIKQKNFEAEKWLQYYAEPAYRFAGLLGLDTRTSYLDLAWNLVVQNSAHDSIGGCSLDEVHDDMMNRYKQSIEIAHGVYERAHKHIIKQLDIRGAFGATGGDRGIYLYAYNPLPVERDEVTEAFIDIPKERDKGGLRIEDVKGRQLPLQILSVEDHHPVFEQLTDRPMYFAMRRYHIQVNLKHVPQTGYTVYRVIPAQREGAIEHLAKLERKATVLENSHVRVAFNPDGTFNLQDKKTSSVYKGLGYFVDEGELGHAWVHKPCGPLADTRKGKPKIRVSQNGPLSASVVVEHILNVPAKRTGKAKQARDTKLPLTLTVTLHKDSARINLHISTVNHAENHRLRIHFPTGLATDEHRAEGQFDVVKRAIPRPDTSTWIEQPMYDYPLHNFMDMSDGKRGLGFLVNGLKEYEVFDDAKRTAAFTLYRAFTYIIQPSSVEDYSWQKGAQCPGKHGYEMALYPHAGDWKTGDVYREALQFNNHITLIQAGEASGKNPVSRSFLSINCRHLHLSAVKAAETDPRKLVVRLYNPTGETVKGKVTLFKKIKHAEQVTLEELPIQRVELTPDGHGIECTAGPKKIITFRLTF